MTLKRFKELVRLQSYECKDNHIVKVRMSELSDVVAQMDSIEEELMTLRMANVVLAKQIQTFKDCNLKFLDEVA